MFDNDSAGEKATLKAAKLLLEQGIDSKIVALKNFKDPDDFLLNNKSDELEKLITLAPNSEDFLLEHHYLEYKQASINKKFEILNELTNIKWRKNSETRQVIWLNKITEVFKIDKNALIKNLRNMPSVSSKPSLKDVINR